MSNESTNKSKKKLAAQIIVPVVLISIVFCIWFLKNNQKNLNLVNPDYSDFALHITEEIDLKKLKSYDLPIIIDFGAESCVPCKEMAPILKELNEELRGKAIIKFVDVWKYEELVKDYPVSLLPTQIFIDANGRSFKPKDAMAMQMKLYNSRKTGEHVFTVHEGQMTKEQLLSALIEMGLK